MQIQNDIRVYPRTINIVLNSSFEEEELRNFISSKNEIEQRSNRVLVPSAKLAKELRIEPKSEIGYRNRTSSKHNLKNEVVKQAIQNYSLSGEYVFTKSDILKYLGMPNTAKNRGRLNGHFQPFLKEGFLSINTNKANPFVQATYTIMK